MSFYHLLGLFLLCSVNVVKGQLLELDEIPKSVFDQDLYASVLDAELCEEQIRHMVRQNQLLLLRFLDAGFRIPSGLLEGNANHLGNYFQCLNIREEIEESPIQGKYCHIAVPLNQNFELPFAGEVNGKQLLDFELQRRGRSSDQLKGISELLDTVDISLDNLGIKMGLCIPQACTTHEWVTHMFFNVSIVGFRFAEEFCRLPNDKPWSAADWATVGIFTTIALLTILSTVYDLHCKFTLQREQKQISKLYSCFSVYTNARRLTTFTKSSNALECLDGIRSISMMWVILAHAFSKHNFFENLFELLDYLISGDAVIIATGVFAVDTFFMMTGILLVYTAVGKMTSSQLLKGLHMFYIHRILRLFPLLGAIILLEASFFHRIADGPFWMAVATNAERCRDWWWSTLLYVQNYVNPDKIVLATLLWAISVGMFASVAYSTYSIMQLDWDNQLADNFYNSFSRSVWSLGLSWLIFGCVHGYGGPINWLLSHSIWKLPSRISYAMYLYHYSFMFIAAGMQISSINFSAARSLFEALAHFALSFLASFALTVLIDAPFSTLIKMAIGGGPKKIAHRPQVPQNKPDPEGLPENVKGDN